MAICEKVLLTKVKKFELKGLREHKVIPESTAALEELLQDVYFNSCPKQSDYRHRRDLVQVFNEIAKELYGKSKDCPIVEVFGSFAMDIFSSTSDLDLSVNFNSDAAKFPKEKKIRALWKFAKKLNALQSNGHVYGVQPIMSARVPIVKVVDSGTRIECDISVENRDGILKSHIVGMISSIDARFQKLSFLMKAWAKVHNINSSKDQTLNSLSIILLVAFHLQTRDPPILPPFSVIFEDGTDPSKVKKLVNKFSNYGENNKESLAELFVTLLIKLSSVEKLWPKGLCASTYQGSWISKTWNSTVGYISVEDFTDRSQNVARAVGRAQVEIICKCIQLTVQNVFAFIDGRIQWPTLREFLFGRVTMPGNAGIANFQPPIFLHPIQALIMPLANNLGAAPPPVPFDHFPAKRRRTTEAWIGMPTENWSGTGQVMPIDHVFTLPAEGWGGGTQGWGGMPTAGGWAQTQQPTGVDHNHKHKRKMHTSAGWGSTQHAVPMFPMQADGARSAEGWRPMQLADGNQVVSAGLDNARGRLQPNFFSYHGPLAFEASRSAQSMVQMPYAKGRN